MSLEDQAPASVDSGSFNRHIEIPGDVLIPDADFCRDVLNDCARRTAKRYEAEGLPFVMVAGKKFRPLNAGREWLAARIQAQVAYRPQRRRRAST
jgi:hypothetical protein